MKPTTAELLARVDRWLDQARDDSLPIATRHRAFGNAVRVLDGMTEEEATGIAIQDNMDKMGDS